MLKRLKKKYVVIHIMLHYVCICIQYIGRPMGTNIVTHSGGDRNDRSSSETMDVLRG